MANITKKNLCDVLDCLAFEDSRIEVAMSKIGAGASTFWRWAARSKTDSTFPRIRWPDPDGTEISFAEGVALARRIMLAQTEATLRQQFSQGHDRELRDGSGATVYEIDHALIAEWEGDADAARRLGGIRDPFYRHDERGARIPVRIADQMPASLRQHVARSTLAFAGYNPSDVKDISANVGGVLIIDHASAGQPLPYARPVKPVTPEREAALNKLEDLRDKRAKLAEQFEASRPRERVHAPSHPVRVLGRPSLDGEPREQNTPRRERAPRLEPPDKTNSLTRHPGRSITK